MRHARKDGSILNLRWWGDADNILTDDSCVDTLTAGKAEWSILKSLNGHSADTRGHVSLNVVNIRVGLEGLNLSAVRSDILKCGDSLVVTIDNLLLITLD